MKPDNINKIREKNRIRNKDIMDKTLNGEGVEIKSKSSKNSNNNDINLLIAKLDEFTGK